MPIGTKAPGGLPASADRADVLATYLHRSLPGQVQCKVVKSHADFDSHDELLEIVRDYDPALIGFRSMTYYRDFLEELVSHLRQNGVATPFIAGGAHPTTDCERVLEDENVPDLVVLERRDAARAGRRRACTGRHGRMKTILPPFRELHSEKERRDMNHATPIPFPTFQPVSDRRG